MRYEQQKSIIANYKSVMRPLLNKVNYMSMTELNKVHIETKAAIHQFNPSAPKKLRELVDQWYDGLFSEYQNNNTMFVYRLESGTYTTSSHTKSTSLLNWDQSPEYIKNGLFDFSKCGLLVYRQNINKVWYSSNCHENISGDPVNVSNNINISTDQKVAINTAYNILLNSNSDHADQACLYLKQLITKFSK